MKYTKQLACGCVIRHKYSILDYWVDYCPLHKSAPKLYEALKVARRELLHAQWEDGLDQIELALSEGEGK